METDPTGSPTASGDSNSRITGRWRGALSILLPEGWLAEEVIQIRSPDDGIALSVSGGPTSGTVEDLADRYAEELAELPGYSEISMEEARVMGGRQGLVRIFRWAPDADDATELIQTQTYVVESGAAYVASGASPVESYEANRDVIEGLLASIDRIPPSFEVRERDADRSDGSVAAFLHGALHLDLAPREWQESDWESVASKWRTGTEARENGHQIAFSADELLALAQLFGAPGFPGVGEESYEGYSAETQIIAGRAARRSLLARGIVFVHTEGAVSVAEEIEGILGTALFPGLLVTAESHTPDGVLSTVFHADPTSLIEHGIDPNGVHLLRRLNPGDLPTRIKGLFDLSEVPPSDAPPLKTTMSDLRQSTDRTPDHPFFGFDLRSATLNFLTITHTDDETISGGWLRWFDLGNEGLWSVESLDDSPGDPEGQVRIEPTTKGALMERVLSYLPGAFSD